MIPWQAPNGSSLICQECHQAHKEIQSELKALEETPAEPGILGAGGTPRESRRGPLPQPAAHCALCGEEFLFAGDPSLSCKSCEYRLRQGKGMAVEMEAQEGITREDVGEADPEDANAWTSAVAQSFKRACASFGLCRYLYSLPRL